MVQSDSISFSSPCESVSDRPLDAFPPLPCCTLWVSSSWDFPWLGLYCPVLVLLEWNWCCRAPIRGVRSPGARAPLGLNTTGAEAAEPWLGGLGAGLVAHEFCLLGSFCTDGL